VERYCTYEVLDIGGLLVSLKFKIYCLKLLYISGSGSTILDTGVAKGPEEGTGISGKRSGWARAESDRPNQPARGKVYQDSQANSSRR
jgi:hypothetical protein